MTSVAILGGGGFIGAPLAGMLTERGCKVVSISRTEPKDKTVQGHWRAADRRDPASISAIIKAEKVDCVIDLLAMTLGGTSPLLEVLSGFIGRYVMISSADVYRNYGGLHGKEKVEPILKPMKEAAPMRLSRYPYRQSVFRALMGDGDWVDDYDKIPIEEYVQGAEAPWTILRLPMVYGPGDRQKRFALIVDPMIAGAACLGLPRAWAEWRTTYGYVDNVAAAIADAALSDAVVSEIFNLGDPDVLSHSEWVALFADHLGWKGEVSMIDDDTHRAGALLANLDFSFPLTLDTSKVRRRLGFEDPVNRQDAIERTLAAMS